jgi:2-hydroxy-3-keto-5-methylthiopentenyl-1-phosphate phosphatase
VSARPAEAAPTLALDWDGTCTVADSLVAAIRAFGDPDVWRVTFDSYAESLTAEVATIRATASELSAWAVENVELRPGLHELVRRYEVVIVSSGLPQLILPVLDREALELELRCNDAEPRSDGWRLRFRNERCPVCGDRCKRGSLPQGRPLVYVGDGVSDRCAARAADRVFARGWLAGDLAAAGLSFDRFETLDDVAAALP